jgi:hypothetical protein
MKLRAHLPTMNNPVHESMLEEKLAALESFR